MLERVTIGLLGSVGAALVLGWAGARGYAATGLAAAAGAIGFAGAVTLGRWDRARGGPEAGRASRGGTPAGATAVPPGAPQAEAIAEQDAFASLSAELEREWRAADILRAGPRRAPAPER